MQPENSAQSICITCGFCCNGVLFQRARLHPNDEEARLRESGFEKKIRNEREFFPLPCHHLNGTECQIYSQWRPKICSHFECELLKKHNQGDVSLEQALGIILETELLASEVIRLFDQVIGPNKFNLIEKYNTWSRQTSGQDVQTELKYAALNYRLKKHFRPAAASQKTDQSFYSS